MKKNKNKIQQYIRSKKALKDTIRRKLHSVYSREYDLGKHEMTFKEWRKYEKEKRN